MEADDDDDMFTWYEEIPEDDLRKIDICTKFDELYVKIYIILIYISFFDVT